MPVNVSWDNADHNVVRYDYTGKWTWEEVYAAIDQANALMHSVSHPVSIIHDLTQSAGIPSSALTHAHRITMGIPENWAVSVVVGSGMFTESLLNIFTKIYRKLGDRYQTAHSLDEARVIIARSHAK